MNNHEQSLNYLKKCQKLNGGYYSIEDFDSKTVLFAATSKTGPVQLPRTLVEEWLQALDDGQIHTKMTPREMREKVLSLNSMWARQLHSFETHLSAVVHTIAHWQQVAKDMNS